MKKPKNTFNNYKFYFGFMLLWFIPFTLSGQRYISGRITDAYNGNPIAAATVFFTNTTVGITTDLDGNYRLKIPSEGSYSLMVSHVGYQHVIKEIEPGNKSVVFNTVLQIQELADVEVSAKIRFRKTDINLFWNTILGKNPSKKTIQATNPEVVYYYYNPETHTLKVTCREPLLIINNETGYAIRYVLDYFTHDYDTGFTDWSCQTAFTELQPENIKQKNTWEKKRKEVYDISITKFIKSLYNNTLLNNGFVLADLLLIPDPAIPYTLNLLSENDILQTDPVTNSKTMNINGLVLLFCYGKSLSDYELEKLKPPQQPPQQTAQQITESIPGLSNVPGSSQPTSRYTGGRYLMATNDNVESLQKGIKGLGEGLDNFGKIRNILQGDSVRIFPDGTFTNTLSMGRINKSGSLMGLSLRVPIDYNPDALISAATVVETIDENESNTLTFDFSAVEQCFDKQLSVFPQEKIHVHTDRDMYISGEKIWFKAYVTDANTHLFPTFSRYVYVELISPADTLINRVMVHPVDGMFYGYLPLTEYVPTGNYTLRAYTRHMENLGDDYFFKKNIRIENLSSTINPQRITANRGMLNDDFDVSFFPEGGNLPEGVSSKIAFKALNVNGYPDKITGTLVDENGVEITSVETFYAGMGVFAYKPEVGKRIYLKCKNINGLEKQFELPPSNPSANSLAAYQRGDDLVIEVNSALYAPDIPLYLLAHCRGDVVYFAEWNHEKEAIVFDKEDFPAGIIQFVLFDEQMNPLSERLVFSKNYDADIEQIEFRTDKEEYEKREKVITTFNLSPSPLERTGVRSHLSVSVTDDADIAIDSTTTILSSLLLTSELKGYIENPAWYLQDNPASVIALDYLMLTHGWRRYSIPDVVKGELKYPQIPFQTSQEISGKVLTQPRAISLADGEVSILTKDGDFGITSTDEQGTFTFQDFEYPDSTSFFLQALSKRGSSRVELVVDEASFPKLIYAMQRPFVEIPVIKEVTKEEPESDAFITKAEQRARYDDDMLMIQLGEVEVTAPRIVKKDEARLLFWANASSDMTIKDEEIEKGAAGALTVTDLLRRTAGSGVNVMSNGLISIRGALETEYYTPLVIIDGMPFNFPNPLLSIWDSPLERVTVQDVESIDIFKGVSTTTFGSRGSGGVISITTKRGSISTNPERDDSNYTVYTPLGYQKPAEFYSPRYETLEAKYLTIPDYRTTLFWKPDIVISDSGEAGFEFYTSDFPTTYSIVIEGLTTKGKIVRHIGKIQVK